MATRRDDDAPTVLGVLLHRLASPIGAIANYAHLMPNDDLGCRDGMLDAVGRAGEALEEARSWIDAARALDAEASGPVALDAVVAAATPPSDRSVQCDGPLPSVQSHPAAVAWLLDALLAEAADHLPAGPVRVHAREDDPVSICITVEAPDAAPPATAEGDRWRLAAALAVRAGGHVGRLPEHEGPGLVLTLPGAGKEPPTA